MSKILFVGALLCAGVMAQADAQRIVVPGDTVALVLTDGGPPLTGVVRTVNPARLILQCESSDDREVLVSVIRSMNVLDGRKRATRKGAKVGLIFGVLAGAGVSAADAASSGATSFEADRIPVTMVAGGLGGALIGAMAGLGFETNRWQPAAAPDRGSLSEALQVRPVLRMGLESSLLVGLQLRR